MKPGTRLEKLKMAAEREDEMEESILDLEKIPLTAPEESEMLPENEELTIKLEEQGSDTESVNESNGNSNETSSGKTGKTRGRRGKKTKLGFRCTNYLKV